MWMRDESLKLGKTSAFVKRDLRVLPLTEAEFEADFFFDRKFSTKRREVWKGLVIERESGALLAMVDAEWPPPTVNDLATALAYAMYRPWYGDHQRPRVIYLRDRPQWQELLPHLRQLEIQVVLGEDLPWFDDAAFEWLQDRSSRRASGKRHPAAKTTEEFKSPFPAWKRTAVDAPLALMLWTDSMFKAGYPSARRKTEAAYDPMSTVAIALTAGELDAIITQTRIARTKKLRPRLEAIAAAGAATDLPVSEWAEIMLALCGGLGRPEPSLRKYLLMLAGRIATKLAEVLPIDSPPWADGRWSDESYIDSCCVEGRKERRGYSKVERGSR
jgi:hypothetical protein